MPTKDAEKNREYAKRANKNKKHNQEMKNIKPSSQPMRKDIGLIGKS